MNEGLGELRCRRHFLVYRKVLLLNENSYAENCAAM